jgi:hypothetical protein
MMHPAHARKAALAARWPVVCLFGLDAAIGIASGHITWMYLVGQVPMILLVWVIFYFAIYLMLWANSKVW